MRKKLKVLVLYLFIIAFVTQTVGVSKGSAAQVEKTMTILFTHDLHSNFLPTKSEQNGVVNTKGGYARLQSAIHLEKKQDNNALLLDAGDYSMGTPFQTIYESDAPELRIMGQMGYDVVTLGNHEFDYRASGLAESLNTAKSSGEKLPELVQSNVVFPTDEKGKLTPSLMHLKQAMENYGAKDYVIIERGGVKVGIFGLMGAESASMAPMSEVIFEDEVVHAKRVVKILQEKEKVDLIICLSHSGTKSDKSDSEDEILAKKVPQINVIISGHTHSKLTQPIIVGETMIASGEEYGNNLGVIKLSQKSGDNWDLQSYKLKPINDDLQEDITIAKRIEDFKNVVQTKYFDKFNLKYDEVIATSPYSFQTTSYILDNHEESTLGNLISDAYLYAVKTAEGESYDKVAAAIIPAGTIRGTFYKGDLTAADAFSVSSLGMGADKMSGYPLISVYLTGKELKTACEVDASITPLMEEAQLFLSGVNYTFNPNRLIFNKVINSFLVNDDGTAQKIDDTKLYRIVTGLYSAQMLSVVGDKSFGLLSIIPKTKDGIPITDFEAQIIYDTTSGDKKELKEWLAIVNYLSSFEKVNGVSEIPSYYNETHSRKVVEKSNNIIKLVSNPNPIALTVYSIALVAVLLAIVLIRMIVKRKKNPRRKTNTRSKITPKRKTNP